MDTSSLGKKFQSERLIYRSLEINDQDKEFFFKLENDPVASALASPFLVRPKNKQSVEEFMKELQKAVLAVVLCLTPAEAKNHDIETTEPTPIGYICLGWGGTPPDMGPHRNTHMGIVIADGFRNQGYGAESINWALDWAFKRGGYHRVGIGTFGFNERGQHLYEKLGFVEEGRAREVIWFERKWWDMIDYGMLESEWEALRAKSDK
ncbi:hypothetical protein FNYG_15672 [Fusarium nygamai]|uniref:N-acetyltransferase domain-containing protein n=1 Tax=Gibberella nygamai TaxID=42673 RepID=A0A2K0U7Y2_GIBNY|nr:hypothetical protein FNYG_15672 [Fusarium nygamai]